MVAEVLLGGPLDGQSVATPKPVRKWITTWGAQTVAYTRRQDGRLHYERSHWDDAERQVG